MDYPKISIVTPSLNQGQFIEETIKSVVDQQYPNLEYIIIDGGSTDNTIDVIKKYEKYLSYWVSEKDSGQSDAINKGLLRATGEIFNWLNADDYYAPNTLSLISKNYQENNVNVICGGSRIFSDPNTTIVYSDGTVIHKDNLPKTIGWARIDQPATFFKKSILEKIGPLNTTLHYTMDRELWIKYLTSFDLSKVTVIPDVLVNFRIHGNSKTGTNLEKFNIERDSFFYSLANRYNLKDHKQAIESVCKLDKACVFSPIHADPYLIRRSINYFLWLKADELYVMNNRKKAKICLDAIEALYDKKDQMSLNILRYKNKFLPSFLINTFRKGSKNNG